VLPEVEQDLLADGEAPNPIRLLLADDHTITREGTRRLLEAEDGFEVVGEAADGEEAIRLCRQLRPTVLILDVAMPGLNGIQVAQIVREQLLETRIIVLTGFDNEQYAATLLRLGVNGYLSKSVSSRELVSAVRTVAQGGLHIQTLSSGARDSLTAATGKEAPTPREREVLSLVAEGQRNRDIACSLRISERTVQFHIAQLFAKLDASSRTEMVGSARRHGWIS
jgi:DNA-binding NarL/FixJ family response regulator